jgi:hypothetical protein
VRRIAENVGIIAPNWNVVPGDFQPAIRRSHETGERELVLMRWGSVPCLEFVFGLGEPYIPEPNSVVDEEQLCPRDLFGTPLPAKPAKKVKASATLKTPSLHCALKRTTNQ